MLNDCLYHILDFFTVNLMYDRVHVVKKLKFLCAIELIQSKRVSSFLPPSLFPYLLECSIIESFVNFNLRCPSVRVYDGFKHMLSFWPYESLILRNHFPHSFPEWTVQREEFMEDKVYLFRSFMSEFVFELLSPFTNTRMPIHFLNTVDVSGICEFIEEIQLKIHSLICQMQKQFSVDVKERTLIFENLQCTLREEFCICQGLHSVTSPLKIFFRKILLISCREGDFHNIFSMLHNIPYLELDFWRFDDETAKLIPRYCGANLEGISIKYPLMADVEFLNEFSNLRQLVVSGVNLNGKLIFLGSLTHSLEYLSLVGCRIKHTDLHFIWRHCDTLLQLDLSENSFNEHGLRSISNSLKNFKKLKILELEACNLHKVCKEMGNFVENLLFYCPELILLNLTNNDFSIRVLEEDIYRLTGKESLRLLYVTPSTEFHSGEWDDDDTSERELKKFQDKFSSSTKNSRLFVGWMNKDYYW